MPTDVAIATRRIDIDGLHSCGGCVTDRERAVRIRCPACHREEEVEAGFRWRPFCSRRCKIIDLGNWLDEVYRIPLTTADGEEQDEDAVRESSAG